MLDVFLGLDMALLEQSSAKSTRSPLRTNQSLVYLEIFDFAKARCI